jgi:P-type Ca2+ transporter type 2C
MIWAGTAATYGRGRAVMAGTGMETGFGRIARMLEFVEEGGTPLQQNLDRWEGWTERRGRGRRVGDVPGR